MNVGYDGQLFFANRLDSTNSGTYYVHNQDAKSIFNIFSLGTDYSETTIGSIFPLPMDMQTKTAH